MSKVSWVLLDLYLPSSHNICEWRMWGQWLYGSGGFRYSLHQNQTSKVTEYRKTSWLSLKHFTNPENLLENDLGTYINTGSWTHNASSLKWPYNLRVILKGQFHSHTHVGSCLNSIPYQCLLWTELCSPQICWGPNPSYLRIDCTWALTGVIKLKRGHQGGPWCSTTNVLINRETPGAHSHRGKSGWP